MKKGFSMIELIIVLGIMSLVLYIVFPEIENSEKRTEEKQLQKTTDEVVGFLDLCKSEGRKNNTGSFIILSENKIDYYVVSELREEFIMPEGIRINMKRVNRFDIDGYGNFITKGTIRLVDFKGRFKEITIKVGTGYVSEKK